MSLRTLDRWRLGAEGDVEVDDDVDPRIQARREAVADARRARWRAAMVAVLVVAGLATAGWALSQSAAFDVDAVWVQGTSHLGTDEVVAASGITVGEHLTELDLPRAERAVDGLAWVRSTSIERDWRSGDVTITVVERVPVVTVRADDGWLLVDEDRHVLGVSPVQPSELPVVDGVDPAAVGAALDPTADGPIAVARALTPALRTRVTAVQVGAGGEIVLPLRPAGNVRFGQAVDVDQKVRSLQTVFAQVDLTCLATVDVHVPDAPVLTRDRACL